MDNLPPVRYVSLLPAIVPGSLTMACLAQSFNQLSAITVWGITIEETNVIATVIVIKIALNAGMTGFTPSFVLFKF
jgi:hypothetical protein